MSTPPTIPIDERKSFATQLKERTRTPPTGTLYDTLRAKLKKVAIDGTDLYVAEGDTLLDEDQLWLYSLSRERLVQQTQNANLVRLGGMAAERLLVPPTQPSGLLGMIDEDGNFIRWATDTVLTYCVLKQTFAGPRRDANYQLVVASMQAATGAWEATCNIRFQYRPELDDSPSLRPDGVIFPVRELDTGGAFIAAAFFPNDPIVRRRVVVDPSYYADDLTFDRVGVMRHELGHTLGFRHEHIRSGAPAACRGEETEGTIELTAYDPRSVMHYFCGGVGSRELAITDLDVEGAQLLYGPPPGPTGVESTRASLPRPRVAQPLSVAFVR